MRYMDIELQMMKRSRTVHTWLCAQLKTFCAYGIRKLMEWSNKCVEKVDNYVKK